MKSQTRVFFLCTVLVSLCACTVSFNESPAGPQQETTAHIDRGNAERSRVELNMGAGEMNVQGGAEKLLDARFQFNVPGSDPKVEQSSSGGEETIRISQPKNINIRGDRHYVWNVDLNNEVPLDLRVQCGAGQARLKLGELNLREVQTQMGAGQVDLDLRGKPAHDYTVDISGGVGQATVQLPTDVGIWAEAAGGIGSVTVTGLEKQDNHWQNPLWEKAKANVRLKVHGGIGEIRIIAS